MNSIITSYVGEMERYGLWRVGGEWVGSGNIPNIKLKAKYV